MNIKAGNWTKEDALINAGKQFEQLLPEGLNTKDHVLFSVQYNDEPIGSLWLHVESNSTGKQAFIFDIKLNESQRGKGYGKATMKVLDEYARAEGIIKISLHVFAHNLPAVALYEKMGYKFTDYHMSKEL